MYYSLYITCELNVCVHKNCFPKQTLQVADTIKNQNDSFISLFALQTSYFVEWYRLVNKYLCLFLMYFQHIIYLLSFQFFFWLHFFSTQFDLISLLDVIYDK